MVNVITEGSRMLPLRGLRITNPNLDQSYVSKLITQLQEGSVFPEDLQPIYVRRIGSRFFVADGNHRVSALGKVYGELDVFSDIYSLEG